MVQGSALAVAIDRPETEYPGFTGRQQLLAGEFRRGVQVERLKPAVRADGLGGEGGEMRLIARRNLQRGGIDLDEVALGKPVAQRGRDAVARHEARTPVGMDVRRPPW